jgi:hypothetical protein
MSKSHIYQEPYFLPPVMRGLMSAANIMDGINADFGTDSDPGNNGLSSKQPGE